MRRPSAYATEIRQEPNPVSATSLVVEVERHCARNGLNFTRSRRLVLDILAGQGGALGAYTIIERLADEGVNAKPAIVYRALDFLIAHGFAHKIKGLNAFAACTFPHQAHLPVFLICSGCGTVVEMPLSSTEALLGKRTEIHGFRVEHALIEVKGCCSDCMAAGTTHESN